MTQVLIIEDEARAANQLQNLLVKGGFEFELLDIVDTVEDSVAWFKTHEAPDLVFMDIQLADGLSFEIFSQVPVKSPIIFTTAFDQYAIKAFKVNSVDYLLKPIQQADLRSALQKFTDSRQGKSMDMDIVSRMLADLQRSQERKGILVKEGDGFVQIQIADLLYVYSEDSITFGVTTSKRFIIEETLDELQTSLNASEFYRINRGQLVAKKAIKKIDRYFNHRLKLTVANDREMEFIVSRPQTTSFKAWLNS